MQEGPIFFILLICFLVMIIAVVWITIFLIYINNEIKEETINYGTEEKFLAFGIPLWIVLLWMYIILVGIEFFVI